LGEKRKAAGALNKLSDQESRLASWSKTKGEQRRGQDAVGGIAQRKGREGRQTKGKSRDTSRGSSGIELYGHLGRSRKKQYERGGAEKAASRDWVKTAFIKGRGGEHTIWVPGLETH